MKIKNERGITLIALLIMLVVLIILSAVVIRGITDDNLIDTTMGAADDYNINSYKEQVDQTVRGIVLKNLAGGKDINVAEIAKNMNEVETLWVKSAIASDGKTSKEDVIVTVKDGYVYEVYYDPIYGVIFTEYIGRDDGKGFPELNTKYEKSKAKITGTALSEAGEEIKSIELIYRGEVKETSKDSNISFNVENVGTGWYIVKVTSSSGKVRYNWIRVATVSDKLSAPTIKVTAKQGIGENKWYNKASGDITVEITANSKAATGIRYWTTSDLNNDPSGEGTPVSERTASITVDAEGTTRIIAVEIDKEENESENRASDIVYKDTKNPEQEITQKIKGTDTNAVLPESGWFKEEVEVTVAVKDEEGSGPNGYEYKINNGNVATIAGNEWTRKKVADKIIFNTEGRNVILIRGLDIAGNTSEEVTVEVKLDKTPPVFTDIEQNQKIQISSVKTTEFTAKALASDALSGNASYEGEVTYKCTVINKKTGLQEGEPQENETGEFRITDLSPKVQYEVTIEAKDPAGNTDTVTTVTSTQGELLKPKITISQGEGDTVVNDWHRGTVKIEIQDAASSETTGATGIHYRITNTDTGREVYSTDRRGETSVAYDFSSEDGNMQVVAYVIGTSENGEESDPVPFKRDSAAPTVPNLTVGEKTINTITVTATSSDVTSKIKSYQFEYSETGADGSWKTPTNEDNGLKEVNNLQTCAYTYEGLEDGTTYYFKVTVTDNAGLSASNDGTKTSGETEVVKTVEEALKQETGFDQNTKVKDKYGNMFTVPKGFKIVPNGKDEVVYKDPTSPTVQDGIVIEDVNAGGKGNQFVWIPVGTLKNGNETGVSNATIELARYKFDVTWNSSSSILEGTGTATPVQGIEEYDKSSNEETNKAYRIYVDGDGSYVESYGNYYYESTEEKGNKVAKSLENFKNGVAKNGGYYLARFEASGKSSGIAKTVKEAEPWNYITQLDASKYSQAMYNDDEQGSKGYQSDLVNSYAWDTAIFFIQECSKYNDYAKQSGESETGKVANTGENTLKSPAERDQRCNICDMAGNMVEWSTETYAGSFGHCVDRGGIYTGSGNYTSSRGYATGSTYDIIGFRPILYVK